MGAGVTSSLKNTMVHFFKWLSLNSEVLGNYCLVSKLPFIMKVIEIPVAVRELNTIMKWIMYCQYGFEPEHAVGKALVC